MATGAVDEPGQPAGAPSDPPQAPHWPRPRLTSPRSSPSPGGEEGEGRQEHRDPRAPGISCLTKTGAPCGWAGQSRAGCAAVSPSPPLSSQTSRPLPRLTPCQVMGSLLWPPQARPPRSNHPSFCSSNPSHCNVSFPPSTYPNPHLPPRFEPCLSPAPPDPATSLSSSTSIQLFYLLLYSLSSYRCVSGLFLLCPQMP